MKASGDNRTIRSSGRPIVLATVRAGALLFVLAILLFWGFVLTFGAAKATPRPSDPMLALNGVATLAAVACAIPSIVLKGRSKAAIIGFMVSLLFLIVLTIALIVQQG